MIVYMLQSYHFGMPVPYIDLMIFFDMKYWSKSPSMEKNPNNGEMYIFTV